MYGNFLKAVRQSSKLEFLEFFKFTRETPRRIKVDTRKVAQQYRLNQWIEIVRQCRSSGQTIAGWCTEHNIS